MTKHSILIRSPRKSLYLRGLFANSILPCPGILACGALLAMSSMPAVAQTFTAGNLVVSRLVYQDVGEAAALQAGVTVLPNTNLKKANNDGTFPGVFNNLSQDANFGVTAPIFLDQLSTGGSLISSYAVSTSAIVSSFSSKSEGSLNLSQDGTKLTFTGYGAPVGAIDRSNTGTPGIAISGNSDTATATYREVAQVDAQGNIQATKTNAYTGDNPRAAILGNNGLYYAVGNTGASGASAASATGVQIMTPGVDATSSSPGTTSAGSFAISQAGYTQGTDKIEKDNNFRGLAMHNDTVFVTKGSGSNGINTVYQVGTAGTLPTGTANAITILPGFNTGLAKNISNTTPANAAATEFHPFGLSFGNDTTLYVADEGDGTLADAGDLNKDPNAGLQKWIFNGTQWNLAYTLKLGLGLGVGYTVSGDANTIITDGLRDITGQLNGDGTYTIFGITATLSSGVEPGADPNRLVSITDSLSFTTAGQASTETFNILETAASGEVLRGVSFAPREVPEPSTYALALGGLAWLISLRLRRARRETLNRVR